jgi:hypothetical protein
LQPTGTAPIATRERTTDHGTRHNPHGWRIGESNGEYGPSHGRDVNLESQNGAQRHRRSVRGCRRRWSRLGRRCCEIPVVDGNECWTVLRDGDRHWKLLGNGDRWWRLLGNGSDVEWLLIGCDRIGAILGDRNDQWPVLRDRHRFGAVFSNRNERWKLLGDGNDQRSVFGDRNQHRSVLGNGDDFGSLLGDERTIGHRIRPPGLVLDRALERRPRNCR